MSKLSRLPKDLSGRRFQTDEGVKFRIRGGKFFPDRTIGQQHARYLSTVRVGLLVSVSFHGHPVSLITVDGGVVRLTGVEINKELIEGSTTISKKLRVTQTRQPVGLYAL